MYFTLGLKISKANFCIIQTLVELVAVDRSENCVPASACLKPLRHVILAPAMEEINMAEPSWHCVLFQSGHLIFCL